MTYRNEKLIAMLGTRFDTMGGIASVVNVYRTAGLFDRWPVNYIATHRDGSAFAKLAIMFKAAISFYWLLAQLRVQIVHIHVSSRASFWRKSIFAVPAMLFRVPVILHLHGSEFAAFYDNECGVMRKWIVRKVFDHAARVIVLSSSWKNWVENISDNPAVVCVYNPVVIPPELSQASRIRSKSILFLGRLGKRKGTYDLIHAFDAVRRQTAGSKLLLGGDGDISQIRTLASRLGLESEVELLGWVGNADKAELFSSAAVYVLPSYNEGLPMSILEAMSFGLPIVSTTIGGIPEAVEDGVEGFLMEPGDTDTLALRLTQLLQDPSLVLEMGQAARRKVETTFSAGVLLPQIEHIWNTLGCRSR